MNIKFRQSLKIKTKLLLCHIYVKSKTKFKTLAMLI